MIDVRRREILIAALGLPAVTLASEAFAAPAAGAPLSIFDPGTLAGRRFARHAIGGGVQPVAIDGDRVQFAALVLAHRPAFVVGVTRYADQLLISGVAAELGYRQYLSMDHATGAPVARGSGSWSCAGRMLTAASPHWPEMLAELTGAGAIASGAPRNATADDASGWILAKPA